MGRGGAKHQYDFPRQVDRVRHWSVTLLLIGFFRHSESPVEVERKKRQLESVRRRQRREAILDLEATSDVDDVLEAGEVLLDQIERDVVRDVELEQEFSHLMEEENDEQVNPKRTMIVLTVL